MCDRKPNTNLPSQLLQTQGEPDADAEPTILEEGEPWPFSHSVLQLQAPVYELTFQLSKLQPPTHSSGFGLENTGCH